MKKEEIEKFTNLFDLIKYQENLEEKSTAINKANEEGQYEQ